MRLETKDDLCFRLLRKHRWTERDIYLARKLGLLKPKMRDGCSDYGLCRLIDKWIPGFSGAMKPYCDAHDDDYEIGDYSGKTRAEADFEFFEQSAGMVKKLGGNFGTRMALEALRMAYFVGVRVGGPRIWKADYSWGFGINKTI